MLVHKKTNKEIHKEMYMLIRSWEIKAGEQFLDENEIVNRYNLLFWLFGKGLLSIKQFNYWIDRLERTSKEYYLDISTIFFDDFTNKMCVLHPILDINDYSSDELIMEVYILSELFSSLGIYIKRIKEVFLDHNIEFSVSSGWKEDLEEEFFEISKKVKTLFV